MSASLVLLLLIYAAFVSLGLPDGAFGVSWPAMRLDLHQPLEALGLATLLWTACSAISSFASGQVLARLGTFWVVVLSGFLTAVALLGFSLAPSFAWVVVLALPLGLGAGSVDAGLNHFAASHYSSRHMNWLHASWGVGATLGPLAMTASLATRGGWRAGYTWIAAAQFTLVAILFSSKRLWPKAPARTQEEHAPAASAPSTPTARHVHARALWLAPAAYTLYVGAEGGIGTWAASVLRDSRGFDAELAGSIASSYFAAITVGRLVSGAAANRLGNRQLVRVGLAIAGIGTVLFALPLGPWVAALGVGLAGFGLAPIYPCLMHETPHRFDEATARLVVGRQVAAAYVGGMLLTPLFGLLAARLGLVIVAPAVAAVIAVLALTIAALDRVTPPLDHAQTNPSG